MIVTVAGWLLARAFCVDAAAPSIADAIVADGAVFNCELALVYIDAGAMPICNLAFGDGQVVYRQVAGAGDVENAIGVTAGDGEVTTFDGDG